MDQGVISVRYARALLKSAAQAKVEEGVYKDMITLAQSYIKVHELRTAIDNPMLEKTVKQQLLETAAGGSIQDLTKTFFQLVLNEGRETTVQFMATAYITLYRKQKNITSGKLITATAVTPQTEKKMRQMVENRTHGTVEFQTEVNPDIIGGFILEYDTYRMDASVQSRLREILAELKK